MRRRGRAAAPITAQGAAEPNEAAGLARARARLCDARAVGREAPASDRRSLRVLYFGTYERRYPRNAQVIAALRRTGVDVRERHVPVWDDQQHKWGAGIRAIPRLVLAEARLLRRPAPGFDAVVVGYPGHLDLPAARLAARGRPVLFNPLVSLHDTLVEDRRRFQPVSPAARLLALIDRRALSAADMVVADTRAHADFLAALGRLPPERVRVCFVGAEERLFAPGWAPRGRFTALFVGKLIPVHGVETVLAAARAAPEISFTIVGSGQLERPLHDRPPNVAWTRWVEYERLPAELHRAGCALGIFGTSGKATRVIPNKVFQALACGTPVITADTPAARELLADGESALLIPAGDGDALAGAVRRLSDDPILARRIGEGGRRAYEELASEDVLGRRWRSLLEELVS